ncbi:hypothetical protein NIES4106_60610 (plasmid) [Fischerella sp. NIES-4106]|nr:hypothetical protein NIES4106_60610 [Fischerella sp. NIES-4106]
MTEAKIQGKFYPLQHEEWLRAYKELTDSQRGVLYYLRSLDPYSNGLRIRASKIARDLGISRQTVYKAIDVLEQKGYIDKQDVEYTLKIQSKGFLCDSCSTVTQLSPSGDSCKSEATVVSVERQLSPSGDSCKSEATVVSVERQLPSESLTQHESQNSKINKTYLDFLDSLSEGNRESFLEFGKKKASQLPRPPELPLKWIESNFEELAAQWRKTPNGAATNSKWENDPRRQEWLDKIRSLGFGTFIYESGKRDKEREEFFKWANANNLIWGAES